MTIAVSSSDEGEGIVTPKVLTFTPDNWDEVQSVIVTGVDDKVDDGDVGYDITIPAAVSDDGAYDGLDPADLTLVNVDDDTAGITVSTISGDTTEAGQEATFTVVLDSEPTADVTISLTSSDATEGTLPEKSVTFTAYDWQTPQVVSVVGADDHVDDGDVGYSIFADAVVSPDPVYFGMDVVDVLVTNLDDDVAGVDVSEIDSDTSEWGVTSSFSVVLRSQPTGIVRVDLMSSDASEGLPASDYVLFTPETWDAPQIVTVTGVDDDIDDGDVQYMVVTAVTSDADPVYDGIQASDVTIQNLDDDTAAIFVSSISGDTSETGAEATFSIVLGSEPISEVTIELSSSDTTEGTVGISSVTFTPGDWDVSQTVTVTGVDDSLDDGDVAYEIVINPAVSVDPGYDGLESGGVVVTNLDDPLDGLTWQNSVHAYDVNADGLITPEDILLLIDYLNTHGSGVLPIPPSPGNAPPPYLDPSGDNEITPFDILLVLSYLNEFGAGPVPGASESEGAGGTPGGPSSSGGEGEAAPSSPASTVLDTQRFESSVAASANSGVSFEPDGDAIGLVQSSRFGANLDANSRADCVLSEADRDEDPLLTANELEDILSDIADDVNRCWASPLV